MKHFVKVPLFLAIFFFGCGDSSNQNENTSNVDKGKKTAITLKGSDTVLPLSQKLAEEYMKENKEAEISVTGGGSGVGVASLIDGTTDIGMASRDLKMDEKLKFSEKKIDLKEVTIAFDALSVIVHPSNKVSNLTREQLEAIFTGQVSNWSELGGEDMKIVPYSRESSSGTYEFFKEEVMNKKNYAAGILMMPATGSIVQSVSQTPGAIGYIGIAYQTQEVKPVSISYDQGSTFVEPTLENSINKSYPVSRPLYFNYNAADEAKVKPFIDYALSEKGQQIVEQIGYIPVQ